MHARVTRLQVAPERVAEVNDHYRSTVVPKARDLEGFRGAVALLDRETGNVFSFTLWESEEAMQASEEAANRIRSETATELEFTPTVERYEVGTFELAPPVTG